MHSVLIIDDHDIVRLGLEVLLQRLPQVRLVGSASTLRDALAAIERLRPDLVISDMGLGDASGLDTVQALARAQEIARALDLSARTVDIHRANLKKKLGLRSGAELIAFASSRL